MNPSVVALAVASLAVPESANLKMGRSVSTRNRTASLNMCPIFAGEFSKRHKHSKFSNLN